MQKCAVEDAAKVEVSVCFNFIDEIWGGLGVGGVAYRELFPLLTCVCPPFDKDFNFYRF